tara:strand:- start:524 stop:955 length:432 start_codon:yes stop_codon:yes gene_type:complete
MSDMDLSNLLNALDNDSNEKIMSLTKSKIKDQKNNILQRLQLNRETLKIYHKKLENYRYVSDLTDFKFGSYIRWISLKNIEQLKLTKGAILCDYKIVKGQIHVVCKSGFGRIFQIKFDEVEIFQKLSYQEKVLLHVIDMLDKN